MGFLGLYLGGAVADTTDPTITVISPTPGVPPGDPGGFPADYVTAKDTPVIVELDDVSPGLGLAYTHVVRVMPGGDEHTIYRGGAFKFPYDADSTAVYDGSKLTLSIRYNGGWPAGTTELDLDLVTIDLGANIAEEA